MMLKEKKVLIKKNEDGSVWVKYVLYSRRLSIKGGGVSNALFRFYQKYAWDLVSVLMNQVKNLLSKDDDWRELFVVNEEEVRPARARLLCVSSKQALSVDLFDKSKRLVWDRIHYLSDEYEYEEEADVSKKVRINKIINLLKRKIKNFKKDVKLRSKLLSVCLVTNVSFVGELWVSDNNGKDWVLLDDSSFSTLGVLKDNVFIRLKEDSCFKKKVGGVMVS